MSNVINTKGYNCLSCGNQLYFRSSETSGHRYSWHWSKAIMKCDTCDITYGDPEVLKAKTIKISGTSRSEFDGTYEKIKPELDMSGTNDFNLDGYYKKLKIKPNAKK